MRMKGIVVCSWMGEMVLLTHDHARLSAQELLECSFLAVEPDVQLLATDPSHKLLTLQVVFKGSDKVSVKFEFNVVMYSTSYAMIAIGYSCLE